MLVAALLAGCASARIPPLTDAAMRVRRINADDGLACKYLKNVDYTAKLTGMDESYELVREAADNGMRNLVASVGGNAYVNTREDVDGHWAKHIHYSAEVFECPSK